MKTRERADGEALLSTEENEPYDLATTCDDSQRCAYQVLKLQSALVGELRAQRAELTAQREILFDLVSLERRRVESQETLEKLRIESRERLELAGLSEARLHDDARSEAIDRFRELIISLGPLAAVVFGGGSRGMPVSVPVASTPGEVSPVITPPPAPRQETNGVSSASTVHGAGPREPGRA